MPNLRDTQLVHQCWDRGITVFACYLSLLRPCLITLGSLRHVVHDCLRHLDVFHHLQIDTEEAINISDNQDSADGLCVDCGSCDICDELGKRWKR